jgi:prolyl-tRNA synthetase
MENKVRISNYYLPLLKDVSKDVKLISHQYSLRAGLIRQCGSGIYTWLPLGLRIIRNIEKIIREELNKEGLIEILMPCVQQADVWKESGRYDDYGKEMLKFKDRHDHEMLFGPTNEELITKIARETISSYKQLPKILYHMQWKFRDEIRPRFGLMRAREFLMKDAYSFDLDPSSAKLSYDKIYKTYLKIFKRIGVDVIPCKADSGAIGGNLNHEFHLITSGSGESKIFYDKKIINLIEDFHTIDSDHNKTNDIISELQNTEAFTEELHNSESKNPNIISANGIEVGHIFYFADKYSKCLKAQVSDEHGKLNNLYMGSYGIGISRLVAAIIEANHDKNGIIWPKEIAPFKYGLINLHDESREVAENLFKSLDNVIYDDTKDSAGEKFSRMDLIGIPIQIIVGKNFFKNNSFEIKYRKKNNKIETCGTSL